jgi:hypothetical protein
MQQLAYTDPDTYLEVYQPLRSQCSWSAPESVEDHSRRYMRSRDLKHGRFGEGMAPWPVFLPDRRGVRSAKVSTCVHNFTDEEGNLVETYFTKFGPVELHPDMSQTWFLIPAGPVTTEKTSFLVETVDGYYDVQGKPVGFPPVQPHHAALFMTGFDDNNTYYGRDVMAGEEEETSWIIPCYCPPFFLFHQCSVFLCNSITTFLFRPPSVCV